MRTQKRKIKEKRSKRIRAMSLTTHATATPRENISACRYTHKHTYTHTYTHNQKEREDRKMLWSTLFNRIGKQPLSFTQHSHVYAILENPKTGEWERVPLCLKYDVKNHPYFVKETKAGSATKE